MCGCGPIRCPAAPDTDWSSYTWRWQHAAADAFPYTGGTVGAPIIFTRQLQATDRQMWHPGVCKCLWIVPLSDVLVQSGQSYQSPAFGVLQRSGQSWLLSIARWFWGNSSAYWADNAWRSWNVDEAFAGECGFFTGGYAGWTPFGWNGYGWAYGWGWGWGYYAGSYATVATYQLTGAKLLSDGSANSFILVDFAQHASGEDPPDNWNVSRYWPPTVILSRMPKTGGA